MFFQFLLADTWLDNAFLFIVLVRPSLLEHQKLVFVIIKIWCFDLLINCLLRYVMACMGTSFFNSCWLIHDWTMQKSILIHCPGLSKPPRALKVSIWKNQDLMFWYVMACMGTSFFNSFWLIHDWTMQKSIFIHRPGSSQPPRAPEVSIWNNQDLMFWFAN